MDPEKLVVYTEALAASTAALEVLREVKGVDPAKLAMAAQSVAVQVARIGLMSAPAPVVQPPARLGLGRLKSAGALSAPPGRLMGVACMGKPLKASGAPRSVLMEQLAGIEALPPQLRAGALLNFANSCVGKAEELDPSLKGADEPDDDIDGEDEDLDDEEENETDAEEGADEAQSQPATPPPLPPGGKGKNGSK